MQNFAFLITFGMFHLATKLYFFEKYILKYRDKQLYNLYKYN